MLAGKAPDPTQIFAGGEAREQAAETVGVGARYVSEAKALKTEAEDMFEEVKAGTVPGRVKDTSGNLAGGV